MSAEIPLSIDKSPSNVLTSEYWGGHNPVGECSLELPIEEELRREEDIVARWSLKDRFRYSRLNPINIAKKIAVRREQQRLNTYARGVIKDFLQINTGVLVRKFTRGEIFDGNNFPPGTVVSIFSERLTSSSGELNYDNERDYGVVCHSELFRSHSKRTIKVFPIVEKEGNSFVLIDGIYPVDEMFMSTPVELGHTTHSRISRTGWNQLVRTLLINVHQLGYGLPEKITVQSGLGVIGFKPAQ